MDARTIVIAALLLNAVLGFGYRVYRLARGGSVADVYGQAVLGVVLAALAMGIAGGVGWARWASFGYGLLFAVAVMPVWVLAVLLPQRPYAPDWAFTGIYWLALVVVLVGALAL